MNAIQKLRLLAYHAVAPSIKFVRVVLENLSENAQQEIREVRFVGPSAILEDAASVLADFQSCSPELCSALYEHGPIGLYYCRWLERDASYKKSFFVGNETLVWGKTGILTHLVWTAFKLRAGLHVPSISFWDAYAGSPLQKNAALRISEWLSEHNQPAELVESYFATAIRS